MRMYGTEEAFSCRTWLRSWKTSFRKPQLNHQYLLNSGVINFLNFRPCSLKQQNIAEHKCNLKDTNNTLYSDYKQCTKIKTQSFSKETNAILLTNEVTRYQARHEPS